VIRPCCRSLAKISVSNDLLPDQTYPGRATSPFCPTIRPFLITTDGEGNLSIAAANKTGSIPTSCGLAVCQLPEGNSAAVAGGGIRSGRSDVLALAGSPTWAETTAAMTAVAMKIRTANSRGNGVVFFFAVLYARVRRLRERFANIFISIILEFAVTHFCLHLDLRRLRRCLNLTRAQFTQTSTEEVI
jgi:hypothetical protein